MNVGEAKIKVDFIFRAVEKKAVKIQHIFTPKSLHNDVWL